MVKTDINISVTTANGSSFTFSFIITLLLFSKQIWNIIVQTKIKFPSKQPRHLVLKMEHRKLYISTQMTLLVC